jgi:hypothetical protein
MLDTLLQARRAKSNGRWADAAAPIDWAARPGSMTTLNWMRTLCKRWTQTANQVDLTK